MSDQNTERPEDMAAFFDARAAGYDDHMRNNIFPGPAYAGFYRAMSSPIPPTGEPLPILDLGCGTGLEIDPMLQRVPRARITGVDLSRNMLDQLRTRYAAHMGQITLVADSYLTVPLGTGAYDHVLSAMANHHLLHEAKRALYRRIRAALKPGGTYVEGDSVIVPEMQDQLLAEYHAEIARVPQSRDGQVHIDIPFTLETQESLLLEAGFRDFRLVWHRETGVGWNMAVYVVTA